MRTQEIVTVLVILCKFFLIWSAASLLRRFVSQVISDWYVCVLYMQVCVCGLFRLFGKA